MFGSRRSTPDSAAEPDELVSPRVISNLTTPNRVISNQIEDGQVCAGVSADEDDGVIPHRVISNRVISNKIAPHRVISNRVISNRSGKGPRRRGQRFVAAAFAVVAPLGLVAALSTAAAPHAVAAPVS